VKLEGWQLFKVRQTQEDSGPKPEPEWHDKTMQRTQTPHQVIKISKSIKRHIKSGIPRQGVASNISH
jgi:hypothetical protein